MSQTEFDDLQERLSSGGEQAVLDRLIDQLREQRKHHELFEALKMRSRRALGLPLLYSDSGDELSPSQRSRLEEGLLDACREVGLMLLDDGRVREGWIYLRPVGDREAAAAALADLEVDEENLEDLIEVLLHEGVDPQRGYRLVLEHFGTCNAITMYESALVQRSKLEQQTVVGLLVEHLHDELIAAVKADIAEREKAEPPESTLAELVADRDWLFGENSYHLDTTHLASTVRFARILDDPRRLRLALDLTEYGRRLSDPFQYQGDEPLADIYPSHALYFQALLGENVDEAIRYFREKAETLDSRQHGAAPTEVYVDLLARLGKPLEALEEAIRLTPEDAPLLGLAPSLLELSTQAGNFDAMLDYCRNKGDLLGFAAGLVKREEMNPKETA